MNKKSSFIFPMDVEGWLSKEEGKLLYNLAKRNIEKGIVVELGCYHGRSTICLAQGSRDSKGGKVMAIDNFIGDTLTGTTDDFYDTFCANAGKYMLLEWIEPLQGSFHKMCITWEKPIRLLFIDGSHIYEDVKRDYDLWAPHIAEEGIVAFHDSLMWPGVHRLIIELINTGKYKNITTLKSQAGLTYMTKVRSKKNISQASIDLHLSTFTKEGKLRKIMRKWTGAKEKNALLQRLVKPSNET